MPISHRPSQQAFSPTGLTGAIAPSRYVGGTVSGAPVSGTFAVGDFVIDQSGTVWVCTVAGTPGTWVSTGASSEITSLALTSPDPLVSSTAVSSYVDVTGASITVPDNARPVWVHFRGRTRHTVVDAVVVVSLNNGATVLQEAEQDYKNAAGNDSGFSGDYRVAPHSGLLTLKLAFINYTAGTATIRASVAHPVQMWAVAT